MFLERIFQMRINTYLSKKENKKLKENIKAPNFTLSDKRWWILIFKHTLKKGSNKTSNCRDYGDSLLNICSMERRS